MVTKSRIERDPYAYTVERIMEQHKVEQYVYWRRVHDSEIGGGYVLRFWLDVTQDGIPELFLRVTSDADDIWRVFEGGQRENQHQLLTDKLWLPRYDFSLRNDNMMTTISTVEMINGDYFKVIECGFEKDGDVHHFVKRMMGLGTEGSSIPNERNDQYRAFGLGEIQEPEIEKLTLLELLENGSNGSWRKSHGMHDQSPHSLHLDAFETTTLQRYQKVPHIEAVEILARAKASGWMRTK